MCFYSGLQRVDSLSNNLCIKEGKQQTNYLLGQTSVYAEMDSPSDG